MTPEEKLPYHLENMRRSLRTHDRDQAIRDLKGALHAFGELVEKILKR